MKHHARVIGVLLAASLLCALPSQPALADHELDRTYDISSYANWDHGDLSVLIIPPAHGQIFNLDSGVLNGGDPKEVTPFNSYLAAIEAAIKGGMTRST